MKSVVLALLFVAGCSSDPAPAATKGAAPPPPEVSVDTIAPRAVTLIKELPGRTSAFRVAEVRARVNGIVLRRNFEEGAEVKVGQLLFVIDPAPYQATLDAANAQVSRAEATLASAKLLEERYAELVKNNAISRQEYDDAVARSKTSQADVAAAKAAAKSARINLDYTRVTSPIAGRIGRAEVTEGAYVQAGSATLLATVQQLDTLYVDMTWSSAEVMRMRRAIADGKLQAVNGEAKTTVILEDGRVYSEQGTLQFADVSVDSTTGSILLRAIVPNPKGELFPGMFVRARIEEGTTTEAILVQQRAVTRDQSGKPVAMVVKDGKVERRQITTDRAIDSSWLVTSGLAAGEQVIIEGLQKVRPGASVRVVPFKAPAVATGPVGSGSAGSASAAGSNAGSASPTGSASPNGSASPTGRASPTGSAAPTGSAK
jgi:membrane fusion protein (multidrug efflux system)